MPLAIWVIYLFKPSQEWENYVTYATWANSFYCSTLISKCSSVVPLDIFHILHDSCGIRNVCINVTVFGRTLRIQLCWILEAKSSTCLALSIHSSTFRSTESRKKGAQRTICLFFLLTICTWSILRPPGLRLCMSMCVSFDSVCVWCNLFCLLLVYRQTIFKKRHF